VVDVNNKTANCRDDFRSYSGRRIGR